MNVKPTPTSPKAKKSSSDLEKLYGDKTLKTFVRPAQSAGASILLAFLFGIVGGVGAVFGLSALQSASGSTFLFTDTGSEPTVTTPVRQVTSVATSVSAARAHILPSVISIFTKRDPAQSFTDQLYIDADRLGTGLIVTNDGWAIAHRDAFPDLAGSYVAVLGDRRVVDVTTVLRDPSTPFYYIQLDTQGLTPAEFVNEETLTSGDTVVVVEGNAPYAETALQASLKDVDHRSFNSREGVIASSETFTRDYRLAEPLRLADGTIVTDVEGKVIGMVMPTDSDVVSRIEPADHLRTGLTSLLKNGRVVRNVLGAQVIDLAVSLNVPTTLSHTRDRGAVIVNAPDGTLGVTEGSPAADASLSAGDLITKVGSYELNGIQSLSDVLQRFDAGDTIDMTVINPQGKERTATVTFDTTE